MDLKFVMRWETIGWLKNNFFIIFRFIFWILRKWSKLFQSLGYLSRSLSCRPFLLPQCQCYFWRKKYSCTGLNRLSRTQMQFRRWKMQIGRSIRSDFSIELTDSLDSDFESCWLRFWVMNQADTIITTVLTFDTKVIFCALVTQRLINWFSKIYNL